MALWSETSIRSLLSTWPALFGRPAGRAAGKGRRRSALCRSINHRAQEQVCGLCHGRACAEALAPQKQQLLQAKKRPARPKFVARPGGFAHLQRGGLRLLLKSNLRTVSSPIALIIEQETDRYRKKGSLHPSCPLRCLCATGIHKKRRQQLAIYSMIGRFIVLPPIRLPGRYLPGSTRKELPDASVYGSSLC